MRTWDIVKKELAINAIDLKDPKTCIFEYKGKRIAAPIPKKINLIKNDLKANFSLFDSLWKDVAATLSKPAEKREKAIDIKVARLFVESLKDMLCFLDFLIDNSECCKDVLTSVRGQVKAALNKDIYDFPKSTISSIPDYKISLDWVFRRNSLLVYQMRLLRFASLGELHVDSHSVKTARTVSGPWANLDLPMQERVWKWDDIEEEMSGRNSDIAKQRRYRMGLENYNGDGRVGEGFNWREIRNEPYSWADRSTESPYPSRSILR